MSELIVGIVGMFILYWVGMTFYSEPPHKTIQQELIKMGDERDE